MADIELVIKISEEEYTRIQSMDWKNGDRIYDEAERAIHYGTPLTKGHGRLIDANVLIDGFEDNYEFCEAVNATPTVIEADSEVGE